jgi:NADH-quinone oxidoreductase subunit N
MPEILIAFTLAFVIASEITYEGERLRLVTTISLLGLGAAFFYTLYSYGYGPAQVFGGVLSFDGFALFFKLLFIVLAILTTVSIGHTEEINLDRRTEYCALILASTLAMCLVSSAADVILAYLSVLFLNVVSYFLSAFGRRSVLSTEAAIKYLAFGTVAAALFLYSVAILFAYTHSLNIYEMHKVLLLHGLPPKVMLVVFSFIFLSMSFQMGAFPMFLITPDIFEGSPTPVVSFLSVGTRAAGFAMAIRFLIVIFTQPGLSAGHWEILGGLDWTQMASVVSGLTMIMGGLLALRQKSAKRLVGYLVVAETGFLMMGLLVLDQVGIAALFYNLVIHLFSLTGIFYVLAFIFGEIGSDQIEDLRGMLKRAVFEGICLVAFLLCFIGSPPLPGFIGKFTLIGAAIGNGRYPLALVSVLSMVLSSAAVARLSYHMVGDFRKSVRPLQPSFTRKTYLAILVIPMTLAGIFAGAVLKGAGESLGFIFW